jgi:hypothetical protein
MRFTKIFVFLLTLTFTISSCGNLRIKTEMPYQTNAKVKKVALAAVYLNPPLLAETPAGDAPTFNRRLISHQDEIKALFTKEVAKLTNELGMGIEAQYALTTEYGQNLKKLKGYDRLVSKMEKEALKKENEVFSEILISDGSISLFDFEEGEVEDYLENSPRLRSQVKSIGKSLDAELIVFANATVVIDKVQRYGTKANVRLLIDIYLFDEDGRLVGQSYGETEPYIIEGSSAKEFSGVFDAYPVLQKLILTDLQKVDE